MTSTYSRYMRGFTSILRKEVKPLAEKLSPSFVFADDKLEAIRQFENSNKYDKYEPLSHAARIISDYTNELLSRR